MPQRVFSPRAPLAAGSILQLKVWLHEVSPMVWRRLLVPGDCTLRELHGIIQVAMGWEGVHLFQFCLRSARFGSWQLSASSPDVTLDRLQLRRRARFTYEYDLNIPWRHELRLEDRLQKVEGQTYPASSGGSGACPPEDSGGPAGYHLRRDDWWSLEAIDDLETMSDIIGKVVHERRLELLDDPDTRSALETVLNRSRTRERWKGVSFSRRSINARLRRAEHLELMHQQF